MPSVTISVGASTISVGAARGVDHPSEARITSVISL
jgi:hypothetical protein